jgi:hypothetical protein
VKLMTQKKPVKQSYSRMLETYYQKNHSAGSSPIDGPAIKASPFIHEWEPLGSPFRKLKRGPLPASDKRSVPARSSSSLGNYDEARKHHGTLKKSGHLAPMAYSQVDPTIRSHSAPLFEDLRDLNKTLPQIKQEPPPRADYSNMTRDQRRQEILKMLYYDRNAEYFQSSFPEDNLYNNENSFGVVGTTTTHMS